jgi:hypothetical protein
VRLCVSRLIILTLLIDEKTFGMAVNILTYTFQKCPSGLLVHREIFTVNIFRYFLVNIQP